MNKYTLPFLLIHFLAAPINSFSQKTKKSPEPQEKQNKYELLGISLSSSTGNESKFFYNQPNAISLIGCPTCEIKAHTIFETDPTKKVYLDASQFKVEKIKNTFIMNDCEVESSFITKNSSVVTLLIGWAPIAPITLEFYNNGIKLPIEREFSMEY
jgi:hypothetical protein